jgi:hypothetical protein
MQTAPENRQFYQTNLKTGKLYRLTEFRTLNGSGSPLTRRIALWGDEALVDYLFNLPANTVVMYIGSRFPKYNGDQFDRYRIALHRVIYGETMGWLDGRWVLEEEVCETLKTLDTTPETK